MLANLCRSLAKFGPVLTNTRPKSHFRRNVQAPAAKFGRCWPILAEFGGRRPDMTPTVLPGGIILKHLLSDFAVSFRRLVRQRAIRFDFVEDSYTPLAARRRNISPAFVAHCS